MRKGKRDVEARGGESHTIKKMDTIQEFKQVQDLVEQLLSMDKRCRNDDKWLTYRVMRHYTNIYIPFEDFEKLPAFETIKRCRAKIQNVEKKYLPTDPKVIAKRQKRQSDVRVWIRGQREQNDN